MGAGQTIYIVDARHDPNAALELAGDRDRARRAMGAVRAWHAERSKPAADAFGCEHRTRRAGGDLCRDFRAGRQGAVVHRIGDGIESALMVLGRCAVGHVDQRCWSRRLGKSVDGQRPVITAAPISAVSGLTFNATWARPVTGSYVLNVSVLDSVGKSATASIPVTITVK